MLFRKFSQFQVKFIEIYDAACSMNLLHPASWTPGEGDRPASWTPGGGDRPASWTPGGGDRPASRTPGGFFNPNIL